MIPTLETLDRRRLLTVSTFVDPNHQWFVANGTEQADTFTVSADGGSTSDGSVRVIVTENATEIFNQTILGLKFVFVNGLGGDDTITVSSTDTDAYAFVTGGVGKDTITGSAFNSNGQRIDAGADDDNVSFTQAGSTWSVIDLGTGNDTASVLYGIGFGGDGVIVHGGTGNDSVVLDTQGTGTNSSWGFVDGGDGNDTITDSVTGAAGLHGFFTGDAGEDVLVGGSLQDYLAGGADNDSITGNAGQDILQGDAGTDTLNSAGDSEQDWVVSDASDSVNAGAEDVVYVV